MQMHNRDLRGSLHRLLHGFVDPEVGRDCREKIVRQAGFPRFVLAHYIRNIFWKSLSRLGACQDFRKLRASDLINRL
jgi:hypothetical protein